jgi:hypothetical protein
VRRKMRVWKISGRNSRCRTTKSLSNERQRPAAFHLALPHPNDLPAQPSQVLIYLPVTLLVPAYLRTPKLGVRGWDRLARTTMPKASVYKERHLALRPRKIRCAWNWPVFSIAPQASSPEKPCHCDLRAQVAL